MGEAPAAEGTGGAAQSAGTPRVSSTAHSPCQLPGAVSPGHRRKCAFHVISPMTDTAAETKQLLSQLDFLGKCALQNRIYDLFVSDDFVNLPQHLGKPEPGGIRADASICIHAAHGHVPRQGDRMWLRRGFISTRVGCDCTLVAA